MASPQRPPSYHFDSLSEESESLPSKYDLRDRKRKRLKTKSGRRSYDRMTKKTKSCQTHSRPKLKVIKPTDAVCLYKEDNDYLPSYIKIGEQVLKCLGPTNAELAHFKPPPSLTKSQEEHKKCIFACVEIMLGGLTLKDRLFETDMDLEDNISSQDERFQKSKDVEKKFHDSNAISLCLFKFYDSLIEGFGYGVARNGLQSIFQMCVDIFQKTNPAVISVDNVGGTSREGFDGSIGIAKRIYHFDKGSTEEDKRSEAVAVLNCEKAEVKDYVPDVTLCKHCGRGKHFFMFTECLVMKKNDTFIQPSQVRVWHQALRGLFEQDSAYGCVINGIKGEFWKLKVEEDTLETYYLPFNLSNTDYSVGFTEFFDVNLFKEFIETVISIIQESL